LPSLFALSILILISQRLYGDFFDGLGYRSVLVIVLKGEINSLIIITMTLGTTGKGKYFTNCYTKD
jgi:hypothetical protein